jgi:transcriptional regulator with XRE-family HTH domain
MTDGEHPDDLDELLRELVREGLDRRKWTQFQLARTVGLSEKHLSQLLNGRTAGSVAVWDRLLKAVREEEEEEP